MQPIASARSAPMIQVVPLDTIVQTNMAPIAYARNCENAV